MSSPTQRTLEECRRRLWRAYVCEKWIPQTRRRADAFGFGDVLVIDDKPGALLIQATTTGNMSSRIKKIAEECGDAANAWLDAGNRIQVWGWAKRGLRGHRKLWTLKVYDVEGITHEDHS